MALSLYNTKSRTVEPFTPLKSDVVTMYACGPTVYDFTHIGHMRKYIGDDILKRTLTLLGYNVRHVMNITDVGHLTNDSDQGDDKFESKAHAEGKTVWDIAEHYTEYFTHTMQAVNVLPPTITAKATDHIESMKILIERLVAKGHAYETAQAIYFDVTTDPTYGGLSGQKLADKETGSRDDVITDSEKHHPADFALWFKCTGRFADHAMHWPSPCNIVEEGFPGWHIECSAMSMEYLGDTIDIHTGGIDHIPVHHENEIAQSQCATGHDFVRYWVHHDFLLVDGEKMSKSKHNFYTIDDIIARGFNPLAIRLMCMQTSYRKPLNFTWESLENAEHLLKKIQKAVARRTDDATESAFYVETFKNALSEDINTARALAVVAELLSDTTMTPADIGATLLSMDVVLGLNLASVPLFAITPQAQTLVETRDTARLQKDFAQSDALRHELETLGYIVKDTNEGTVLE